MKVLYLHQYFNTPQMDGSTRSYEMAKRLVGKGHSVEIVTTDRNSDAINSWRVSYEDGIKVNWYKNDYSNRMSNIDRIKSFFRFAVAASRRSFSLEYDVVFATSTPLTIAIPGLFASWLRKKPLVFEVRDLWPDVPIALGALRNPILRFAARILELCAYRFSKRIVALAPGMKDHIAKMGLAPGKIDVIPNGCDNYLFASDNVSPKSIRDLDAWIGQNPVVLYTGTMGDVNGVEYIVRLAAAIRSLDLNIRFILIGDGKKRDAAELLSVDLGVLETNLRFIGKLPKIQVANWLKIADFSIITYTGPEICYRDSVSNKFFDSISAGKPVVANFRGFSTIIAEQWGCCRILSPYDYNKAARDLIQIIYDESWKSKAKIAARELAEDEFDRNKLADRLEKCLVKAVSS